MSFDWNNYFELARELASADTLKSNTEAQLRSAISRAYFAAFGSAVNYLYEKYNASFDSSENKHRAVRDYFDSRVSDRENEVSRFLKNLRDYRNDADYENVMDNLDNYVRLSIEYSHRILNDIEFLLRYH